MFRYCDNYKVPTRCWILNQVEKCVKMIIRPPLKDIHKRKSIEWNEKKKKYISYTNITLYLLGQTDGTKAKWFWQKIPSKVEMLTRLRWSDVLDGILHNEVVCLWNVLNTVKTSAQTYIDFVFFESMNWVIIMLTERWFLYTTMLCHIKSRKLVSI